jgi:alpha-galactosidase
LLACFNWEDYDSETELTLDHFSLPNREYHFRSFWDDRISQLQRGNIIFSGKIPAHGVLLLAARMVGNSSAVYLGSDLHISQGLEITSWEVKKNQLKFDIQSGKKLSGKVDVLIEAAPSKITIDGEPSTWEMLGNRICRILIPEKDHSSITIM